MKQLVAALLIPLLTIAAGLAPVPAAMAAGNSEPMQGPQYVDLQPAFITNYGGPGPVHFLKADLAVRVGDAAGAALVAHHMPQLRHELVMLLSSQTEDSVGNPAGRETLRQSALAAVQAVLRGETGGPVVEDLLFNGFVLQR